MRGAETKQATMLSLLSPEQRVPKDHPLRPIKQLADQALQELSPVFDAMYSTRGPAVGATRAIAESQPADGVLLGAQRATLLRAARLQPDVSLVPRYEHGRGELRPQHLQLESGQIARARR